MRTELDKGTRIDVPNFGGKYGINVETLTGDKTLTVGTDEIYQYLDPGTTSRYVTLSTTGASAGDRFVVRHNGSYSSSYSLRVMQSAVTLDIIYAGGVKEFIFDGTNWISRGIGTGEDDDKKHNVAIGFSANARASGVAIGDTAIGWNSAVAVGRNASGHTYGVSVGCDSLGNTYGVGIGTDADGSSYGISIGKSAITSKRYGIAIGYYSRCYRAAETAVNIDGDIWQKNQVVQGRWAGDTADAVQTELLLGARVGERFNLRAKSALAFKGLVVASTVAAAGVPNVTKAWSVEGLIKRDADGNTTMVAIAHTVIGNDAGAAAWDALFDADDVFETLRLRVTGEDATTIQWAAFIDGVETVYSY